MVVGDLLIVRSHSYPSDWKYGDQPHYYATPTSVIYLGEIKEEGQVGRIFYRILTPTGVHQINSVFCEVME